MKILFLTDSLSLPREGKEEFVAYEDTYINTLRKNFPEHTIIDSAIGGATILDLYKQVFYYKNFKPDMLILHCGIVDCAPRAWRSLGRKIKAKLGLKLAGLTRFLRKYRGLRYTHPNKFNKYASEIRREFKEVPVFAIGILPASDDYEKKVPGITKSIKLYNSILAKHFDLIDNTDFPENAIMDDFHHLNKKGHQLITEKIANILRK